VVFINLLLGFGVMKVGLPGMVPFSIARIALIIPEIPAAGSECPRLLLIYHFAEYESADAQSMG